MRYPAVFSFFVPIASLIGPFTQQAADSKTLSSQLLPAARCLPVPSELTASLSKGRGAVS